MRFIIISLLFLATTVAQAQVQDDINELIDRFFGEGQAPTLEEAVPAELTTSMSADEVRESIQLEETILESFNTEIQEREAALWDLQGQRNTIQQQIETIDQQIGLDQQRVETYRAQEKKWQSILTEITEQKALLSSAIRAEKTDYQTLMAQAYIRAQNLGSDDRVAWWEWLFSPRSVSQILEARAERKRVLDQKQNSLKTLDQLRLELESRERQAAVVYSHVAGLSDQLLTDKQKLSQLVQARATLLDQIARDTETEEQALSEARSERQSSTQYLVQLRDQLRDTPERQDLVDLPEPEDAPVSVLDWPLKVPIRVTANFRDSEYADTFGREHDGLDLFAPQGSGVFAPANGIVEKVATNGYGYSYLILAHKNGLYTVYGHLSEILVEVDEVVYIGKEIAKSGGTPGTPGAGYFTTGPHLHFEVFRDGTFYDPLDFLPSLD